LTDQCIYPYVSSFKNQYGNLVRFTYNGFLLKDTRKPLYLARSDDGEIIVVKFCPDGYGADAHNFMADLGYAPKLHACEQVGHMHMAVMEFVEGEQWFSPLHTEIYWSKLENAIQIFHKAGFVHGDLRAPNILVSSKGPILLDFDWAGKKGKVRYSWVLNHHDIRWHDGADVNELIEPEHDVFMLGQLKCII
jgi:serine/threonine protein kinase